MGLLSAIASLFGRTGDAPPRVDPKLELPPLRLPDPPDMVAESVDQHLVITVTVTVAESTETPEPAAARRSSKISDWAERIDDDLLGITFVIDYCDAKGNETRRRIGMRDMYARDGEIYISAICFERSAVRHFRMDRIVRVIDLDGEIFEPPSRFFVDELKVRLPEDSKPSDSAAVPIMRSAAPTADVRDSAPRAVAPAIDRAAEGPGYAQRRAARDELRVLVALARSDGRLHSAELDVILDHIEAVALAAGVDSDAADRAALRAYLERQRPTAQVLSKCLETIELYEEGAITRLLQAAERVVVADGTEHPAEVQLLADIRAKVTAR